MPYQRISYIHKVPACLFNTMWTQSSRSPSSFLSLSLLWKNTIPKLNSVLLVSHRLSAKCAASISLLTSFHCYDWFSAVSYPQTFPLNHLPINALPYAHPYSYRKSVKRGRTRTHTHTRTETHTEKWNETEMKALLQYQSLSNPFWGKQGNL